MANEKTWRKVKAGTYTDGTLTIVREQTRGTYAGVVWETFNDNGVRIAVNTTLKRAIAGAVPRVNPLAAQIRYLRGY